MSLGPEHAHLSLITQRRLPALPGAAGVAPSVRLAAGTCRGCTDDAYAVCHTPWADSPYSIRCVDQLRQPTAHLTGRTGAGLRTQRYGVAAPVAAPGATCASGRA